MHILYRPARRGCGGPCAQLREELLGACRIAEELELSTASINLGVTVSKLFSYAVAVIALATHTAQSQLADAQQLLQQERC